jgi:hypothetical protein
VLMWLKHLRDPTLPDFQPEVLDPHDLRIQEKSCLSREEIR